MSQPTAKPKTPWWHELSSEELLDVRRCDLDLQIPGTALERRIGQLYGELERKGVGFKPYVWLSTDWFTPDESTGFAVPFYLAHPRLARLEHSQMFEAEGSTHSWCMKLLRHEAGHAVDNAYDLHRRSDWRDAFGVYSAPYRVAYQVDPTSTDYVQHLGNWYAQSHPAEDFAESFAVWLAPQSGWQRAYRGWGALDKLECVDGLLDAVSGKRPVRRSRDRLESLPRQRQTLREYYRKKQSETTRYRRTRFDHELRSLFADKHEAPRREHAATLLARERQEMRKKVSSLTGQSRYLVDQVIDQLIQRCRELDLRVIKPRSQARLGAAVLVTMGALQLTRGHRPRFHR